MKKILLVEDSKESYKLVEMALSSISEVKWATNMAEAKEIIPKESFDLYLLDMELPDGNGVELCTPIQSKNPNAIIFFLTSHDQLSEKVLSFSAGADDYITKPFEPLELKARIEARFRKMDLSKDQMSHMKWKELEIETLTQEVKVFDGSQWQTIDLTALEFKLLMYFATRANHVIYRDKILDDIWGKDVHVYPRSVDTHVSKLRKKLGPVSSLIDSIHGAGYKFIPTPI